VRNGSPHKGRRRTRLDNKHDARETPMRSAHHGRWPEEIAVQGPRGAVLRNPQLHLQSLDEKAVEQDLLVRLDESPHGQDLLLKPAESPRRQDLLVKPDESPHRHDLMSCALDLNGNRRLDGRAGTTRAIRMHHEDDGIRRQTRLRTAIETNQITHTANLPGGNYIRLHSVYLLDPLLCGPFPWFIG